MQMCKLEVTLLLNVTPSDDMSALEDSICDKVEELTDIDQVVRVYVSDMEYLDDDGGQEV